jgi:hypothetical protein
MGSRSMGALDRSRPRRPTGAATGADPVSEPLTSTSFQNSCPTRSVEQPAGPRIFIIGCARSGTTLLLNLMRTFDGVSVMDHETCLRELVANPSAGWVTAKRKAHCAGHLLEDLPDLRQVWVIDIVRDPRDVITSTREGPDPRDFQPTWDGFYCDLQRWRRDVLVAAALRGRHMRMLHVRYEHLVKACDQVQQDLAAMLGLEARVPFSSHLSVMPEDLPESTRIMLGGVRPVSSDRVGRWRQDPRSRDRVAEQLRLHPDMESWLQAAAYPPTKPPATPAPPTHPGPPGAGSATAGPGRTPTMRMSGDGPHPVHQQGPGPTPTMRMSGDGPHPVHQQGPGPTPTTRMSGDGPHPDHRQQH